MSNQDGNSSFNAGATTQEFGFDRTQVEQMARLDLNFLAAMALPSVFIHKFPETLVAIWGILCKNVSLDNFFRLALGIPRGHAKTTLIKLFVLYCILFTDRKFILIICATEPLAVNFLDDVAGMLDHPNIKAAFGDWSIAKTEDNKQKKKFSFRGRDIVLFATGQGSVRGLNINNDRPDMIILDDAQTKENAESDAESVALLNWIQSTVMKLRSPRRCMYIYIGNMYRVKSPCVCILAKLKQNPLWISLITGAILSDGQPLWPKLHSMESLLDEFENDFHMGTPEVFLAELMNDVDHSISSVIDLTKIPLNPYEEMKDQCTGRFVIIDVATNKIGADDTTIGLHGIYDGIKVVMEELTFGSLSPLQTIEAALEMAMRSGATVIAVEGVAYQSSLLFWFDRVAQEIQLQGIEFVEVMPKGTKNGRILLYFKQLLGMRDKDNPEKQLAPDVYLGFDVRAHVFKEISEFRPNTKNNVDNIIDMGSYWQQVMEKYSHLIALPHTLNKQDSDGVGVPTDNASF